MKQLSWSLILLIPLATLSVKGEQIRGKWMGQKLPGKKAAVFAPGIVSTGMYERDFTISPKGDEIFYRVRNRSGISKLVYLKMKGGIWSNPQLAPFTSAPQYKDMEPMFSPDGQKLYFVSNRPGSKNGSFDIWFTEKQKGRWKKPLLLPGPVNTDKDEFYPSFTSSGRIYFTGKRGSDPNEYIFRATLSDNVFSNVEKLGTRPNSGIARYNAFIAVDESYIIVPQYRKKDKRPYEAYFICFRSSDDTWSHPINLSEVIIPESRQNHSAYVTPDGRHLFFMANRVHKPEEVFKKGLTYKKIAEFHNSHKNSNPDIYWIDASVIEDLRVKAQW